MNMENYDTKHTPGPWIANRLEDGDPDTGPDGDYYFDGTFFALRDGGASTEDVSLRNEANVRLIAAAPELLASCIEFLPILERHIESINPGGVAEASTAFQTAKARVERMRTAIIKATTGG